MSTETPDSGADAAAEADADSEAEAAAETDEGGEGAGATATSWPVRYAREQFAHLLVVVALAAYPGIYSVLVNSPLGAEMVTILPRVETMVVVFYFGLFAMSFDFISGYTGYLSFGHAAFYGTGAYFVILASNGKLAFTVPYTSFTLLEPNSSFVVLLVVAGLVAVVLAILIGAVSFRLTGVYFAMITLGFAQVLYVFVREWDYLASNPSDGPAVLERTDPFSIGVPGVDSLNLAIGQLAGDSVEGLLGVLSFNQAEVSYYMVGLVVLLCYFAMQRIIHSPFGRVLVAIRENEERAEAVGYDTFWYKLGAFAVSAFFAAVAGGLFAGFQRSVSPENTFYFLVTGDALLASIIGGFGTLAGPLYGWLFDETVTEFLSKSGQGGGLLPYLRDHLGEATMTTELYNGLTVGGAIDTFLNGHAELYIGVIFVLFVLFVPNGLLGTVRDRLGGPVGKRVAARLGGDDE